MIYYIFLLCSISAFAIFITSSILYNKVIEDLEKNKCDETTIVKIKKRINETDIMYYTSISLVGMSIILLLLANMREKEIVKQFDYLLFIPVVLAFGTIGLIYVLNKSVEHPFRNCDSDIQLNSNLKHIMAGEAMFLLAVTALILKFDSYSDLHYFPYMLLIYLFGMLKLLYASETNELDEKGFSKLNLYSVIISSAEMVPLLVWLIVSIKNGSATKA